MEGFKVRVARGTVAVALIVVVFSAVLLAGKASAVMAMQTVFINADGSVNPDSVPIQRSGNTYVFTGDVYACLVVNKSDVVIDGAGYALRGALGEAQGDLWIGQGPTPEINETVPYTMGIDTASRSVTGLTIKNLNVRDFSIGMYVRNTNNTVSGNAVVGNIVGVLLSGSNNSIIGNYIADNEMGLFFGTTETENIPLNLTVSRNSFSNNTSHLNGCVCEEYNMTEDVHTWDDGEEGNYWCDYNGTDADGDGIGDTPYVIDVLNQDRYPLIQRCAEPPTVKANVTVEIVVVAMVAVIAVAAVVAVRKKRRKA